LQPGRFFLLKPQAERTQPKKSSFDDISSKSIKKFTFSFEITARMLFGFANVGPSAPAKPAEQKKPKGEKP